MTGARRGLEPARPSRARFMLRRLARHVDKHHDDRSGVAASGALQERLDRLASAVANEMVAEVCSIYALRPGGRLELFATHGLARAAVRHLRMRLGEGLVGLIAQSGEPLNAPDAQAHPNFAYKPETGEEIYSSFVGVPILRAGAVVGVLTVQNVRPLDYDEEEIEALQVVAALVGEIFAAGLATDPRALSRWREPRRFEGRCLVEGVAIGRAWLHEPKVAIRKLLADDPVAERRRLDDAVAQLKRSVDAMLASAELERGEQREVLETYKMFADDRRWLARMVEAIDSGLSAEAAVRKVQDETRVRLEQIADPLIRESLYDLEDLANRLMAHLAGRESAQEFRAMPHDAIVVARSLGPAELIEYDRTKVRAVVLEEGSPTAHVAIVARAFGIPMVGRVTRAMARIENGDRVVVDADDSLVFARPTDEVWSNFARAADIRAAQRARYEAERGLPAVTLDGVEITLLANAAFPIDVAQMAESGADGVGLFRTELALMARASYPGVDDQAAFYRRVLDQAGGKTVAFRTLDVGADKRAAFLRQPEEENPAMGWRALRLTLDRAAIMRDQLRALIAASGGRPLDIMFPMVTEVDEFERARALTLRERGRAIDAGRPVGRLALGAMIETPALLWRLDGLLERADFASLGTNDLLQFVFASDRGSAEMSGRYDPLSPIALSIVAEVVERCAARGAPLTICGEMAGRPLEAMALIGLGARRLSMSVANLGAVKAMLRSLNARALQDYLLPFRNSSARSLRGRLIDYAHDHQIRISGNIFTF